MDRTSHVNGQRVTHTLSALKERIANATPCFTYHSIPDQTIPDHALSKPFIRQTALQKKRRMMKRRWKLLRVL